MTRLAAAGLLLASAGLAATADAPPAYPPPKTLGPVATYGANVQRAMSLLATSSPQKRNTVRVLFYGQSITAGGTWAARVARDLRTRYPYADLHVENRALQGFTADVLVKTAEADLYPAYPDLLIFHVYGPPDRYEDIIRRVRERTTADVLHATDHLSVAHGDVLDEPAGTAGLPPEVKEHRWHNRVFLPDLSRRYATELADVRGLWRQYLTDHKLRVEDLLVDVIHQNDQGDYLLAEVIKSHLRHRPDLPADVWKDRVTTHAVGTDVRWVGGKLTLPFDGNRVDLLFRPGAAGGPAEVRIDGKRPSEFPELYLATRAYNVGLAWPNPVLTRVGSAAPRVAEEWVLDLAATAPDWSRFRFTLTGSATGPDGEGDNTRPFTSKSGRVTIDPADFSAYTLRMLGGYFKVDRLQARWNVVPLFANTAAPPPGRGREYEAAVTVAQGLRPGPHVLELTAGPDCPLEAVRVFRPPLHGASP